MFRISDLEFEISTQFSLAAAQRSRRGARISDGGWRIADLELGIWNLRFRRSFSLAAAQRSRRGARISDGGWRIADFGFSDLRISRPLAIFAGLIPTCSHAESRRRRVVSDFGFGI